MNDIVTVDQVLWGILVAQILPLIVGFVTAEVTKPGVREVLLAFLSGVVVWADEVFAAGSFVWEDAAIRAFTLFIAAVGSYFGWQRNTVAKPVQRSGFSLGA